MKNFIKKLRDKNLAVFLLIFPLAIYFYFGFQHITKFETADEHYWMYSNTNNNNYWVNNNGRIQQYWTAIATGDWKKTRINDKPGITLAYVSGIGAKLKTDLEAKIISGEVAPMSKMEKAEIVNLYFRVPLLIFNGLFVLVLFYLLQKYFKNKQIALMTCTLILLSPIVVGISQIVNPDSLLWEFGFAAFLSFLIFLRDASKKSMLLTGFFLGLGLLTKYTTMIFFPFFAVMLLMYLIANVDQIKTEKWSGKIMRYSIGLFVIYLSALVLYAVVLPNNLVEFRHFMKGSLGFGGMTWFFVGLFVINFVILLEAKYFKAKILLWTIEKIKFLEKAYVPFFIFLPLIIMGVVLANTIFGKDPMGLFTIPFDASEGQFFGKVLTKEVILRQFLPLTFSLTPVVLFGFFYASIKNFKKSSQFNWFLSTGAFFLFVYTAALVMQEVPMTVRYGIMLYPIVITIASIGIYQFAATFKSTCRKAAFVAMIFVASVFSLHSIAPFYFNYMSSLLPKKHIVSDSWGYGGYEAAAHLNSLPGIENARVWSDYNGTCVFVNANCSANKLTMQNIRSDARKKGVTPSFGYFVSNRRGSNLSHDMWESLPGEYGSEQVFLLEIGERQENFVKVYANKQL